MELVAYALRAGLGLVLVVAGAAKSPTEAGSARRSSASGFPLGRRAPSPSSSPA